MKNPIISVFDYFSGHRTIASIVISAISVLLLISAFSLRHNEDITDFLPLNENEKLAINVFQNTSGSNKIVAIISETDSSSSDPGLIVRGVDSFCRNLEEADSCNLISDVMSTADADMVSDIMQYTYTNIPYFLTDEDYRRADSLLAADSYIDRQLDTDRQLLMFPSGGFTGMSVGYDPLNLFSPVISRLQYGGLQADFEIYDDHIFTPDMKRAIVILSTSFPSTDTGNSSLVNELLNGIIASTASQFPGLQTTVIGASVISAGNAAKIRHDVLVASILSGIVIVIILFIYLKRFTRLLFILAAIAWGWLFTFGILAMLYDSISIIIIGIASIITGIAINYPLHVISHISVSADRRSALKEVLPPLLIGNITTVGAFLCLIPLQSALRDLGVFSIALLTGTLIFSIIFLPLLCRAGTINRTSPDNDPSGSSRQHGQSYGSRILLFSVLATTVFLSFFCTDTSFDADIRNMNYMTCEQRQDMEYFQSMLTSDTSTAKLYAISRGASVNEALSHNAMLQLRIDSVADCGLITSRSRLSNFLTDSATCRHRLKRWSDFVNRHAWTFDSALNAKARIKKFASSAFDNFRKIIESDYPYRNPDHFKKLTSTILANNIYVNNENGEAAAIDILTVRKADTDSVISILNRDTEHGMCFDMTATISDVASGISDNFSYIGWASGGIVFILLCISFWNWKLALCAFIPMAVSWIWILGIMSIFNISFNIINVVLATFIFGQGADYALFITQGLYHDSKSDHHLLKDFRRTISVSALIMLAAIGSLIMSSHPALKSLAQITIIGMSVVVILSFVLPPFLFRLLRIKSTRKL